MPIEQYAKEITVFNACNSLIPHLQENLFVKYSPLKVESQTNVFMEYTCQVVWIYAHHTSNKTTELLVFLPVSYGSVRIPCTVKD